ncbi:MAG: tryptophan 2,3-dioxygenase [Schleiferiaceae bacterium]|nr:tryptophan 2,3-dioxygenase [Schleiferiaceae bacterium]
MELSQDILSRIEKLSEKYSASGQDLSAYLDGLLYADYLTYWDYIHLDTLLSLQTPRTAIPDEPIFIMYHQITELYFKLALHELGQLRTQISVSKDHLLERVTRVNRYFEALTTSFGVMENGMDREQFLQFRLALMPASGFQSAQYRMIEIGATPMANLVHKNHRDALQPDASIETCFENIYWKTGATLADTGEKTLTLKQFEKKYATQLIQFAKDFHSVTLWDWYTKLPEADQADQALVNAFKLLDLNVNVYWPLQHYKTAVRYLAKRPSDIAATGGTNWQQYLPPRFQKRIFYPSLWSETEKSEWGKAWVDSVLASIQPSK